MIIYKISVMYRMKSFLLCMLILAVFTTDHHVNSPGYIGFSLSL